MISIVMPCYNCETSLARTVRCVQAQTISDWELIAVDDGSTDGTGSGAGWGWRRMMRGFGQFIRPRRRIAARNIGMAAAGGEMAGLCGRERRSAARALQTVACPGTTARRTPRGAIPFGIRTRADAKKCWPAPTATGRRCWRALSAPTARSIPWCAKLYRASKIREKGLCVPPGVKVGEDVLFNLDAFYAAHAWRMTERSVYGYDLGGDSAMTRADAHVYESAKPMLQGITVFIRKNGLQTVLFRAHIDIYLRTLRKDRGRRKAAFAFNRDIVSRVTEGVQFSALCARQRAYYAALKVCPCLSYFLP